MLACAFQMCVVKVKYLHNKRHIRGSLQFGSQSSQQLLSFLEREKHQVSERQDPLAHNNVVEMSHSKSFASEEEYVMFYSKSADVNSRLLSNFSPNTICIDFAYLGVPHRSIATYPSGEHAFHGGKFKILSALSTASSARQKELLVHSRRFEGATMKDCHYTSAIDAKQGGGRGGIPLHET